MKKLITGIITLIIIITAFLIAAKYMIESAFPDYDGEIRCAGIDNGVEIYRDSIGVPSIYADSREDAAFALGFTHAQERFFQMEMMRRAVEGRLSEIVGEKTVPIDKMFRTLGLFKSARRSWEISSAAAKEIITAYSNGVNEYLNENRNNISIEFDLLDYSPEPWSPVHSISIIKLLAWELNMSWWIDASMIEAAGKLPPDELDDILPYDLPRGYVNKISALIKSAPSIGKFITSNINAENLLGFDASAAGSNAWAVDSSLSASGFPIIANDTHLALSLPGKWFFAVEHIGEYTIAGFTLPGLPAFVIGTNKKIAWGLTNLMADQSDFYIEKIDTADKTYFNGSKREPLVVETDSIKVKGSYGVELKIYRTSRGPIISGRHFYDFFLPDSESVSVAVSISLTADVPADDISSFLNLNSAENISEFRDALRGFSSPGQNFIYADKKGNIALQSAGRIPIRGKPYGAFAFDGTSAENEWKDYINFDELPFRFNPHSGYLFNANNNPDETNKNYISNLWEPNSRAERIKLLIEKEEKIGAEYFKKMQNDIYSNYPKEFVDALIKAFQSAIIKEENLNTALKLLKKWDYKFSKYSQPPAIYSAFFVKLLDNCLRDELGENAFERFTFINNVPLLTMKRLLNNPNSSLWDDKRTENRRESRDEILRRSLSDAVVYLEENLGNNPADWQWGKLHQLTLKHSFHGVNKIIDNYFDLGPFKMGGSGTTLMNSGYSFSRPFDVKLGAAMRFIYDFAEPDVFRFVLPEGQSGHPQHPFYGNLTERWLEGKYIKTNLSAGKETYKYKLLLLPQ